MVVNSSDERGERVLHDIDHFIFTLVDGTFDSVGFVVVHGVADGEAAHEVADPWFVTALVFA